MTPDAVEALHKVAVAVEAHTAQSAGLNATLLADQQQARDLADQRFAEAKDRENRRFRQVNRRFLLLGAGVLATLLLLAGVVVSLSTRSSLATAQRECSDTLLADALVRVSIYATSRGASDPVAIARIRVRLAATRDDPSQLDELRDEVDAVLRTLPADTSGLRDDAARANDRLLRVRDICYRGQPPADPLAK